MTDPREAALRAYKKGIQATRGDLLMKQIAAQEPFDQQGIVHVLAVGKAAAAMAKGYRAGNRNAITGLIIGPTPLAKSSAWRVLESDHPFPTERSLRAGEAAFKFCRDLEPNQTLVVLLSGGTSALMEHLKPGTELADFQQKTKGLYRSGATIQELNAFRKEHSLIKAGGLARVLHKKVNACVYVISDVEGDDLNVIGSAPFLDESRPIPHTILANNETARFAAAASLTKSGYRVTVPEDFVKSDVTDFAQTLVAWAENAQPGEAYVSGGETTLHVTGNGTGGRCQHLALLSASLLAQKGITGITILCAGTDGRDGPTDQAGACISLAPNPTKQDRQRWQGALDTCDTTPLLKAEGYGIPAFTSGTNVNDLMLVLKH